jgi:type IV secretory pathway TraG/TraD family ATPase VirD4
MEFNRGIYFGRSELSDVSSGAERSTLVLGPSRSGKTSSLIIPNLLMSEYSCVITSTKDDVLQLMSKSRRKGANLLSDPTKKASPERQAEQK